MFEPLQSSSGQECGEGFSQSSVNVDSEAEPKNYFQLVPHLNELRMLASQAVGPSAYDLVKMLNREALQAGFEPVGAHSQGISTASFFQQNTEFQAMEDQLARKISSENVSEVFELIKDAGNYKPTGKVLEVIERTYKALISLPAPAGTVGVGLTGGKGASW